ncbi:MAG: DUF2784 family protein [Xanthomonadales bacterium]|nr:DUF2784 domain-containing protein [Xanthomonadales bacterium]NIX11953.1 DUF2784 family protein [Xanthomonadales bacterium]
MIQRLAADALLILHLLFVVAVVLGGLPVLRWPRLAWIHLPVVAWGFTVELTGWICPLTPLEQRLRLAAGEGGYQGGFIDHYLVPLLYPEGLTTATRMLYAALVLGINLAIYRHLWRKRVARRTGGG